MKRSRITALVGGAALLAILGAPTVAAADKGSRSLKAKLKGFEEVPVNSTTGRGEFRGKISRDESSIEFELSYEDLKGTSTLAAHIHLGQKAVNGGISVFLCGGGGRPACTATSGKFTGTITASDVIGPAGQGIVAGEFAEVLRAIRAGVTYANVHTAGPPGSNFPGGEIRGQIKGDDDDDDEDD